MKRLGLNVSILSRFAMGLALSFPAILMAQESHLSRQALQSWDVSLKSRQRTSESTVSQIVGFAGKGKLSYLLSEHLNLAAHGGFIVESGSEHSVLSVDQPQNGLTFDYAQVNVLPVSFLEFSAGALNQAVHSNSLLVSARAFPGAQLSLFTDNELYSLRTYFHSAIPTSVQFSSQTADREPLPHFHVAAVSGSLRPHQNAEVSALIGKWKFENLPSRVASEGQLMGNSVLTESRKFEYAFEGLTASLDGSIHLFKAFRFSAGMNALRNDKAPAGMNEGRSYYTAFQYRATPTLFIEPRYDIFQNQSDSSPAFYNSSTFGHNNRQGEAMSLKMDFLKSGFAVKAEYVNARQLFDTPFQEDDKSMMVYLEVKNATI